MKKEGRFFRKVKKVVEADNDLIEPGDPFEINREII